MRTGTAQTRVHLWKQVFEWWKPRGRELADPSHFSESSCSFQLRPAGWQGWGRCWVIHASDLKQQNKKSYKTELLVHASNKPKCVKVNLHFFSQINTIICCMQQRFRIRGPGCPFCVDHQWLIWVTDLSHSVVLRGHLFTSLKQHRTGNN